MSLIRRLSLGIALNGMLHVALWGQSSGKAAEVGSPDAPNFTSIVPSSASQIGFQIASQLASQIASPMKTGDTEESATFRPQRIEEEGEEKGGDASLPGVDPQNRFFTPFARHLADDQRAFWTAPAHLRLRDMEWLAPVGGITAGFMAEDRWLSKQIPPGKAQAAKTFSDYGTYSLMGSSAGALLLGRLADDDRMLETGLLSGEAAINSTAVAMLLKYATGRARPYQANGSGSFFKGGGSFPSGQAAIAGSIAGVMAHEYPGSLTKLLVYGLATGISGTGVISRQHFPSDVVVGSALGWYFGRRVYRSHHDSELGGAPWGDLPEKTTGDETHTPHSTASPYVPVDSWIYPAIERLIALGYVKGAVLNIRPWTRMACARMVEEAGENIPDQDDGGIAERIYGELSKEFAGEEGRLNGAVNRSAAVDSVYARMTGISGPPLRDGYHFAQTVFNDYGRPFGAGASSVAGASAWAMAGPFAIYLRGEYQQAPSVTPFTTSQLEAMARADLLPAGTPFSVNTGAVSRFQLLEGAASANFRDVQFSFGKQSVWLGPTESGPFLFSDNAAPLPMFKMDSVEPFEVPLLSKLLGPIRSEFFLGRLSGHEWINSPPTLYGPYPSDQPFVHGDKISFAPTENLTMGADFTAVFAGAGVPFTFREFFRTYFSHKANLAQNPGKRFSAFDFSYRIPGLRDWLTVYGDSLVVDEYSPIGSTRASVNPGLYAPRIPGIPKLQLRAEGLNESRRLEFSPGFVYADARYVSGYTNDGILLGNWIGRAGRGGEGWATYSFSPRTSLQFSYRAQRVSSKFLQGGSLNDFAVKWAQSLPAGFGMRTMIQYENWRFPLLAQGRQSNVMSSVQLTYWPKSEKQAR